jgi:hypothetical protein
LICAVNSNNNEKQNDKKFQDLPVHRQPVGHMFNGKPITTRGHIPWL